LSKIRPTHHQLSRIIRNAKKAIEHDYYFANTEKAINQLYVLNIYTYKVWDIICECLDEIKPSNYCGTKPPIESYEINIFGSKLYPFSWYSERFSMTMYLKFAVESGCFYYVSFHKDRYIK